MHKKLTADGRRQSEGTGGHGVESNTVPNEGDDFSSVSEDPLGMLSTSCNVVPSTNHTPWPR